MLIKLLETIKVREAEIYREWCILYDIKVNDKPNYNKMSRKELFNMICKLESVLNDEAEYYAEMLYVSGFYNLKICDVPTCYNFSPYHMNKCSQCSMCLCNAHNFGKIFANLCFKCQTKIIIS
jgi:hypothetical protein